MNKIDMDSAMIDEVKDQIVDLLGCDPDSILAASGKTGQGIEQVLEAIIERIPAPKGDEQAPLQALIFDSVFNPFRGIIAYYRIFNGTLRKGERVKLFNTGSEYTADEVGVLKLKMHPREELRAGDVGYIISGLKTSADVKGRRYDHCAAEPLQRGDRRFRGRQADGVRRAVSGRVGPVRGSAHFAREASSERRLAYLRARVVAGAGLRVPLRVSRTSAYGDHSGTAVPRVRHGCHHDGSERVVQGPYDQGRCARRAQSLGIARARR